MPSSAFFVDRPIFASSLSLVIFLAGVFALFQLPISEYPEVVPPTVVVTAQYPGANPDVISSTIAGPLEEQINGVENMLYIGSRAATDGALAITVTFEVGTDPDLAQQLVQNRVSRALPRLPEVTRQLGVSVSKVSPDVVLFVNVFSPDNRYDKLFLRNYATLNIKDDLSRIKGVAQVDMYGSGDYAMRVWLDPEKMAELSLIPGDVVQAIRGQNQQFGAGAIGAPPYGPDTQLHLPVTVKGRLQTAEEFDQIIIKRGAGGQINRLKDVASSTLGVQSYGLESLVNNVDTVGIAIMAEPGANTLNIAASVEETMERVKATMPEGIDYAIAYNPTVFVRESIAAVQSTLVIAVFLVVLVVILFLQTWRASIVPLLAVPVSIFGTFIFMLAFGISLNVLSLFGLVLAVGIVVDDAIVVVENVMRKLSDGIPPRQAASETMREVTGPVIATTLVLLSVFIPIAFISGLTGQFYRQFALTIAISTVISTINSLTLSPALSALLLRSDMTSSTSGKTSLAHIFFGGFNRLFEKGQTLYSKSVRRILKGLKPATIAYGFLLSATFLSFQMIPSGFVPAQDKGYLTGMALLPPGATQARTEELIKTMIEVGQKQPGVKDTVAFPGMSINGLMTSTSTGLAFFVLDEFEKRQSPELSADQIAAALQEKLSGLNEAFIAVLPPPPVNGMGNVGGFTLQIQDKADRGFVALNDAVQSVLAEAYADPALQGVFSTYNVNFPQVEVLVNRTRAEQLGLPIPQIFETMQSYLGSQYVNDFNQFGRTYQVIAQAAPQFRDTPDDILKLQARTTDGAMVPLGVVAEVKETFGPEMAARHNTYRSADLSGNAASGYSSGEAQAAITRILNETLPDGMSFEWTELSYQQTQTGDTTYLVLPVSLLLIILVLASQYESLSLPFAVVAIVPLGILSAMIGIWFTGGDNNIFTQIALFVLMGLASKNAILVVEFASKLEKAGHSPIDAVVEASRLRLRPILMTSISFIMGTLPLVVTLGAGSEMRQAIGVAVFSGMLGVTVFGLIFTPACFVIVRKLKTHSSAP